MVQQQVIRETVTEEGITKKAREIKQVRLSVFHKLFPKSGPLDKFYSGASGSSARPDNMVRS